MFVILVGPKGSGKTHVGRTLEQSLGIHFFHVEPLWMAFYADCDAQGRPRNTQDGIERVHPQIAHALQAHEHVCVETTGASSEILDGLLSLWPANRTLVVRLWAPLDTCLMRIEGRDQTEQIQMSADRIQTVYEKSVMASIPSHVTLDTSVLSEEEIVSRISTGLDADRRPF